MTKISGIYTITNILNNKIYVGYSNNIEKRYKIHLKLLKENKHHSIKLQYAWNKYEEKNFKFEVLEECSENLMVALEHYWCTILKTHSSKYGYNIRPTNPYNSSSNFNESSKIRLQESIKISNKWKLKRLIILQYDLEGNFIKEWESINKAAKFLNICIGNISKCINNKNNNKNYCSGFLWYLKNNKKITKVNSFIEKTGFQQRLKVINLTKNIEVVYKSYREVSRKTGLNRSNFKDKIGNGYIIINKKTKEKFIIDFYNDDKKNI